MNILDVSTKSGDVTLTEPDLPYLTPALLKEAGIEMTLHELGEAFALGVRLMQEHKPKPGERIRPVAEQELDGHWTVRLSRYSPQTDPALKGRAKGTG
jgi:hypothetical protein